MDSLFFHPKVVHIPIALSVLMPLVATALTLAWWRNWLPARSWLVAVGLQTVLVVGCIVALRTGESEEHRAERVVPETAIRHHESAAKTLLGASAGVLVMMVLASVIKRRRLGLPLATAATLGTVGVAGLGYRTGQAGGTLVYHYNAGSAYAPPGGMPTAAGGSAERDHEQDDED